MSNNKQSSVDAIIKFMKENQYFIGNDLYEFLEQAKAMHKEERISDYLQGANDEAIERNARERFLIKKDAIRWYNETFGGNNDQQ